MIVIVTECPAGYHWGDDQQCHPDALPDDPPPPDVGDGGGGGGGGGGGVSDPGDPGLSVAPAPWTQDDYDSLSEGEKRLVWSDPAKWYGRRDQMRVIRRFAMQTSMEITGQSADIEGSEQNAFQHALWAAAMADAFGYTDAKDWTDAHEDDPKPALQSQLDFDRQKSMDLRNNALGLGYFWNPRGTVREFVVAGRSSLCWLVGPGASASCYYQ